MAEEQQEEQEDENKRIRPRERALGQKNAETKRSFVWFFSINKFPGKKSAYIFCEEPSPCFI